ncbi:cytochrome P450 [Spirillospora sp. NBC_01491]|uniref:cytochrome P450 n=1 Tax=Spirillospora sp. NBC_01491 TaxID=2976007 RepID=UPI002E2FBDBE|nr:cytochrome P450 [Spirillospora sp. NBC_01491]
MDTLHDQAIPDDQAELVFFRILQNPVDEDPAEHYRWLHENAPVFCTETGMVVLSRYADVDAALRDRRLGRGEESVQHLTNLPPDLLEPVMARWKRTMVFANPPLHTRMRRPIASAFTPYHVEQLRKTVRDTARRLLEGLADRPGGDFVRTVASPLGSAVVGDMLGVPERDRAELARLSPESMKVFDPLTAADDLPAAAAAEIRMADYFAELLAERRREPRDDMLTRLAAAASDGTLEEVEVVAASANLMNAGSDTAVNLMSNSMAILLSHPDQLALLREDPGRIPRAVEELARLDPPLNLNPRTALTPCTVAGVELTAGQIVIGIQGAANRDPERFTDPDRVDVTRDEGPSLSFGGGVHFCLGAHLGRLVLAELLACLVTDFSAVEPAGPARRRPGHNLRGLSHLPVNLRR